MYRNPTLLALGLLAALGCSSADTTTGGGGSSAGGNASGGSQSPGGGDTSGGGGASSTAESASGAGGTGGSSGDGGDSSGGSGGHGGFDPGSLAGLELWLVGDHANADSLGNVSTWRDETNHHRDATQLQNSALAPSLRAPAPGFAGHAALHFDLCNRLEVPDGGQGPSFDTRENSYLAVVAAKPTGSDPAYLVVKRPNYPSLSFLLGFNMTSDPTTGGFGADLFRPADEHYLSSTATHYDDSMARVYSVKSRGGKLITSVNGVVVGTVDSSPTEEFIKGAPLEIGAAATSGCFVGDIAEIIMLGNPHDDTDALEAWLLAKYGI